MDTILAVIEDLWNFLWGRQQRLQLKGKQPTLLINAPTDLVKLPERKDNLSLPESNKANQFHTSSLDTVVRPQYVLMADTRVFIRPVFSYDGVITKLLYATEVDVLGYEGRFARINLSDGTGWVLKDNLAAELSEVLPEFVSGTVYEAGNQETIKLRQYIKDEFFTEELLLPLQATEFVYYRLATVGRRLNWPNVRPRQAGNWHNLLKGTTGIKIGLVPKTGSILEYNSEDGHGFVGYTKAVRVDESIVLESVGRHKVGEYKEELVEKPEWQSWRPVWISVG